MREKYGVLILRFETFKKQLTEPNKIGHGAFGTVFRCLIPELGNQSYFAVKVLDRDKQKKLSQEECIGNREFFRELEVLALCRHPNIVRVVAVSFDTADLALFYPFVSGGDLENRMAKRPALSGLDRGTIALQLLDAVTYLHASHPDKPCILHRFVFTNNTRMVFICPRRLHRTYLASQRHETCRLPRAPSPPPPPARPPQGHQAAQRPPRGFRRRRRPGRPPDGLRLGLPLRRGTGRAGGLQRLLHAVWRRERGVRTRLPRRR